MRRKPPSADRFRLNRNMPRIASANESPQHSTYYPFLALFALLAFWAFLRQAPPVNASSVLPRGFKSIGYITSWSGDIRAIPYNKLTHVCYAFMEHKANGDVSIPNPQKLQRLVELAHRNEVKVLISVGGWSGKTTDNAFESLSSQSASRSKFVRNVSDAIQHNELDGVDIDWEFPLPGSAGKFTALIQSLRTELDKRFGNGRKLVSVAVPSDDQGMWYAQGISSDIFPLVDWLNIMAYDGPAIPHANYEWSIASFTFWVGTKKLPVSKAVLGVPFYSKPREVSYKDIVAANSANAQADCIAEGCYNGIPTVKRKALYVLNTGGGGMAYWELSQDETGPLSLVGSVYEEVLAFGMPSKK